VYVLLYLSGFTFDSRSGVDDVGAINIPLHWLKKLPYGQLHSDEVHTRLANVMYWCKMCCIYLDLKVGRRSWLMLESPCKMLGPPARCVMLKRDQTQMLSLQARSPTAC
jgi:hypothetical protein